MNSGVGKLNSWRRTLPVWLFIGLSAALLSLSPSGIWIERTLAWEWMFQLRGERPTPPGVVVVSMDKQHGDLNAVTRSDKQWSRPLFASLIDRLTEAGAAVIVMDVTFEAAVDEASDRALEQALARSNRVVMFQRLNRTAEGDVSIKPIPRFASVARTLAVFPLPKQSRIDGYWPFFRTVDLSGGDEEYKVFPSLPVAALHTTLQDEIGASSLEQLLGTRSHKPEITIDASNGNLAGFSSALTDQHAKSVHSQNSKGFENKPIIEGLSNQMRIETAVNSLKLAHASRGLLPLNFYGPPRTIQTIDHMSVLGDTVEAKRELEQAVSGNVVFIGHSARLAVDQLDGIRTVYTQDSLDLSGVEVAATAYANLTDGSIPQHVSIPLIIVIHLLLGFACAYFSLRTGVLLSVIYTVLVATAYIAFSVWLFTNTYSVVPTGVPVLILLPVCLFLTMIFRYFASNRQVGVYQQGIQQLLPSRVTAVIETGDIKHAEREALHGTCMITDIADFTHFAEKLGHERIGTLSHEYFTLSLQKIIDSGGEIFNVEGDSITAFWGSSEESPQSGQQAAGAAIEIMRNINQFNSTHSDTPFVTRIGLECGWLETRYIGGEGNYRYVLVGDAANTSSRLEGLNKRLGTSVLASRAVVNGSESLLARPVGTFLLKGKSNALEVVELVDRQGGSLAILKEKNERFQAILNFIKTGNRVVVEKELVNFLQIYATDGPARFYLEHICGHGYPDVYLDENGVVHVAGK